MDNKCDSTGKTIFTSKQKAQDTMYSFRTRYWDNTTGKRRNRNNKKPAQKRVYFCDACGGYHLTSMDYFS